MARPRNADKIRKPMAPDEYRSQFAIDAEDMDENYHYRYVETHCMNAETQSLEIAIRAGYEPVPISEMPSKAAKSKMMGKIRGRNAEDDYVRTGDQILMRCPKVFYEQAKKAERRLHKNQMEGVGDAQLSQSIKAPVFVTENNYSRTQELSKAAAAAFADDDE